HATAPAMSTLSLHDALPISIAQLRGKAIRPEKTRSYRLPPGLPPGAIPARVFLEQKLRLQRPRLEDGAPMVWKERYIDRGTELQDRKSTRLNSSHRTTSYAV